MVTVPNDNPETIPVDEPMLATNGLLLVQEPPEVASVKVLLIPKQTVEEPEIAAGAVTTVTVYVV